MTPTLVDPLATPETKDAYSRLLALQSAGQIASATWSNGPSNTGDASFVSATGKSALIKAWDFVPKSENAARYPAEVSRLVSHADAGGIIAIGLHTKNFATGRTCYDRSKTDITPVTSIKKGGANYAAWCAYLDELASFARDDLGGKPFILRLFHEANGWYDYVDKTITGMTTNGTTVTVNTQEAHNYSVGTWVQVVGATPSSVAGNQYVTEIVSSTQFKYQSSGAITTQATTCYRCSGFWWAGRDRRADVMQVYRETVRYFQDAGIHNILWSFNVYPFDGVNYWSTNPSGSDAFGTFDYLGWWPGSQFVDIGSTDYYNRSAVLADVTLSNQTLIDTVGALAAYTNSDGKPFGILEIGFDVAGKQKADFWTNDVMTPIKASMSKTMMIGFWDQNYIPNSGDAAYPSFQAAMADPSVKHLGMA